MKIFHTADWHLGKIVQGVYMTEDQSYILEQFIEDIKKEQPDVIMIAGDLYDRAVPPTDAIHLLDDVLHSIVIDLDIPVLAIAGNHDSPSRLHFASSMMKETGLYMAGTMSPTFEPVVLEDEYGAVHFHLIPYTDPSIVRNVLEDESIRTHDDAMKQVIERIEQTMDPDARHVFVGHAFVTPYGEEEENTSDSERALSIGGAEYVKASHFSSFDYTALGHLHRPHKVTKNTIRYSGSLLKYSISEENHEKGFYIVELGEQGNVTIEKRTLHPRRDMRTIEDSIENILQHEPSDDYVFVHLTDQTPVLMPMEKVRTVYPNALHVDRKQYVHTSMEERQKEQRMNKAEADPIDLFRSFYKEIKGTNVSAAGERIFIEALEELRREETEQ